MKTKFVAAAFIAVMVSCGETDKKAQLAELKKQQAELSAEIKALELELGPVQTDSSKIAMVGFTEIANTTFEHYVEVQGKLDGDQNIAIIPMASGNVVKKYVQAGDKVSAGQVLAQIDDAILQQQLHDIEINAKLATDVYEKQKALWDQGIGSEVQFLQAKTTKESTDKKLSMLREQLDLYKIKSPISGTIAEANAKVGQMASPQLPSPAFRVVSFGQLKVVAEVAEAYSARINQGDEVTIFFPDLNKEIKAKVAVASAYINPVNRTFSIEVHLSSDLSNLKANMIAVLKVCDYHTPKAIVLPLSVIQSDSKGLFVFVNESVKGKNIAKKRIVKTGQTYNGKTEVTEGLKIGDKVITTGSQTLEEGNEIKL